jgi:hypothetical protein
MGAVPEAPSAPAGRVATWTAYAAAVAAFSFAGVSLYWALGGMAAVDTLGPEIERLARERDPLVVAAAWVSVALKVGGGLLALALVRPWGRRLPRRALMLTARLSAVVLITYGGVQTVSVGLLLTGAITPTNHPGSTVLWWRVLVWEPWFLVWGLLLLLATRDRRR